jgi:hypothetical protein
MRPELPSAARRSVFKDRMNPVRRPGARIFANDPIENTTERLSVMDPSSCEEMHEQQSQPQLDEPGFGRNSIRTIIACSIDIMGFGGRYPS